MKNELHTYLKDEIDAVDLELQKDITADITLLQDVFRHIFGAGGKRLRPLLTLAIGKMTSKSNSVQKATILLAAAVELIHTATLLHDDVIDNAAVRRNLPTANSLWDNKTSILVGDNMLSKAFQLIVESDKLRAFKDLADASATISAAEVWQLQILNKIDTSVDEYIRLVTEKTAVLFGSACAVGAITNDCNDEIISSARAFGINFGILYQIKDDWLDYFGDEEKIGKETFQDIREGKVTLPMILLLQKLKEGNFINEINYIKSIYSGSELDRNKISEMIKTFEVEKEITSFSKKYFDEASIALSKISPKDELYLILDGLLNSTFA